MQITVNLTAVLITLIICVTLYALCKMAQKDEKKTDENHELKLKQLNIPENRHSGQAQGLVDYVGERVKREENKK